MSLLSTVNIIKEIVSTLTAVYEIMAPVVVVSPGVYKLNTDCTWWLNNQCQITIDGNEYTIIEFVLNEYITVESIGVAVEPTVSSFDIPAPTYLHGTLKMAANEVDAVNDKDTIYPMIYLHEVLRDVKNTDDESMIDRETELRLFFIGTVETEWITEDHYTNLIDPIGNLISLFLYKLKWNKLFADDLTYNLIPLVNISIDGEQNESLFDCNLSGIEMKLSAQIREDLSCEQKCDCIK